MRRRRAVVGSNRLRNMLEVLRCAKSEERERERTSEERARVRAEEGNGVRRKEERASLALPERMLPLLRIGEREEEGIQARNGRRSTFVSRERRGEKRKNRVRALDSQQSPPL